MRIERAAFGLALLAVLTAVQIPAAQPPAPAPDRVRHVQLSFAQMGTGALELQGMQPAGVLNLGTRGDEVVVGAKLRLRMTYSPALLPDLSHLRVSINEHTIAALPLPREQAGREIEREVVLDPRYFSDYTQIGFKLVGHYANGCEDPQHSSVWLTVNPQSSLELDFQPLELQNDLSLLPAPFFDRRDNRRLNLPIVLPAQSSRALIRSAGVAASWFGMLADYRSARFPVSLGTLPQQHALVFATNAAKPGSLTLAHVQQPTVSVVDHPEDRALKLLVFQGKDDQQLQQAVEGFVLGHAVLTGTSASIAQVSYKPREAYDAPRWLRTDRAVTLGELVDDPAQLQASGMAPQPIRVNLRLPPDLFTWNRTTVPVDLRYRYTSPIQRDNSMLSISINNQLLRAYRLRPETENTGGKLLVPLLQKQGVQQAEDLAIPAFQLASNNQMQFQFSLEQHRKGLCTEVFKDASRHSIDPDSSIDISSFSHYTALPNLALFANAGFPFTKYADLAETGFVLPETRSREALEQLFFLLGRVGRHTGAVAVAYRLLDVEEAKRADDLDLLLLSGAGTNTLLQEWGEDLPLRLKQEDRSLRAAGLAWAGEAADPQVAVRAQGSLGAILSFESPLSGSRTVVALQSTDASAATALIDVLEDEGRVPLIRGELALVRAGQVESFQPETVYYVGKLPWWRWVWFHISLHPVLLTVLVLALAVVAALWVYGWLQRRVAQRLQTNAS